MHHTLIRGNTYQIDVLACACLDGAWDLPETVVDMGDTELDTLPRISTVCGTVVPPKDMDAGIYLVRFAGGRPTRIIRE